MASAETIRRAEKYVARRLSGERRGHSRRVAAAARELAKIHGTNPDRAYLAGLLHDAAREIPPEKLLRLAEEWSIPVGEFEQRQPGLLHAPVAAELVRRELGLEDAEILAAIRTHTTTAPEMSPLGLVLYLADKTEPGRRYPGVERLREVVRERDLYEAAAITLRDQNEHIEAKGREVHPSSRAALEWLEEARDLRVRHRE